MTRARRERLIIDNMPLVHKVARQVARKFSPRLSINDFIQDGMVGLCEAARRCRSVKSFHRFAYFRVRGAMVDAHRRKAYREELNPSLEGMTDDIARRGMDRAHPARGQVGKPIFHGLQRDLAPLPDELAADSERSSWLTRAIQALPQEERDAISHALAGVKVAAIAEQRGRSATWTRGKISNARRQLTLAVIANDAETQSLIGEVLIALERAA